MITEAQDGAPPVKSIDRAVRVLHALAAYPYEGAAFTDLVRDTAFGKSTTHRLLAALIDVGFAFQDLQTRRYRLGSTFTLLGRNALTQHIAAASQAPLERLAAQTEDTVFASVPEGSDAVCIARATGDFPIRTLTLNAGDRRPLGVGAGSLALLAAMPDAAIEKVIARSSRWSHAYEGHSVEVIREMVAATRRNGYAFNPGRVVQGMCAIGVPVLGTDRSPVAALSIAAITERMAPQRHEELVRLLKREAKLLAEEIADVDTPR